MVRVGELLRRSREEQGLNLTDIETATSIRAKYLQAIEDGDYSSLPGEVFAKGFVRNYAIILGLDGNEFMEIFKLELANATSGNQAINNVSSASSDESIEQAVSQPVNNPVTIQTPPAEIKETFSRPTVEPFNTANSKATVTKKLRIGPFIAVIAVFLLIIGIGTYVILQVFFPAQGINDNSDIKQKDAITAVKSNPHEQPKQDTVPTENKELEAFAFALEPTGTINIIPQKDVKIDKIELEVEFVDECWTRVVADEKEVYSGIMGRGKKGKWEAKENVYIKLGNVDAAKLTINGKSVENPAKESGPVVENRIYIQNQEIQN